MKYKGILPFLIFMLFCVSAGFTDTESEKSDIWICPSGETAFYTISGVSYGGGLAIGCGSGTSIGMKLVWFYELNGVSVIELNFLYRVYIYRGPAYSGPFIQFMGGPALFYESNSGFSLPSKTGVFSIGMGFGWRFLIKERWLIEPYIRGGYPYLGGAGLSAGVRF